MLVQLSQQGKEFLNIPKEEVALWSTLIPEFKKKPEICRYANELLNHLNMKFSTGE